ncbi:MAG: Plug domain-containing protein, partial [Pseudomonadota bacterium]
MQHTKTLTTCCLLSLVLAPSASASPQDEAPEAVGELTGQQEADTASPTAPRQVCAEGACTITYEAAFFSRYAPVTALDMVNNLPGFALDDGDSDTRGFGGAAGNVVVNGARISAKSEAPSDILGRIPAADIEYIEVIRGQVGGLDLRGQNVVANVVRRGSSASGAWATG